MFNGKKLFLLTVLFITLFISKNYSYAQQTIFNVPSADVTKKGQIFLQQEAQFLDDFGLFTSYSAFGIGKYTELDLTLLGVGTKKFRSEILAPGFKTSLPLFMAFDQMITFGQLIPISLTGNGVGSYTYGHYNFVLPKIMTRISSGALYASEVIFTKDTFAFIGGIEQPVTKKLSFLLDWTSGSHPNGLLIVGASYCFNSAHCLYAGYQIPNDTKTAADGVVLEYSVKFR